MVLTLVAAIFPTTLCFNRKYLVSFGEKPEIKLLLREENDTNIIHKTEQQILQLKPLNTCKLQGYQFGNFVRQNMRRDLLTT